MKGIMILLTLAWVQNLSAQNATDAKGMKQGPWKKTYENSTQVRYEGQFKDNQAVGKFSYFERNGKLSATLEHTGNGVSYAKNFYESGVLSSEGKYYQQKRDSVWTFYDAGGKILSKEGYAQDIKSGKSQVFHANGSVSLEQNYTDGKLNGPVFTYFENGKLQSEDNFVNDQITGTSKGFFATGIIRTEGSYVNGKKNGIWKEYNEDGTVYQQQRFTNDVGEKPVWMNGVFQEFFDNELPKATYTYKNGLADGPFMEYQDGGTWEFVEKVDPLTEEKNTYRIPKNHYLKRKGSYLKGKLNGKLDLFGTNGGIVNSENYLNGELQ